MEESMLCMLRDTHGNMHGMQPGVLLQSLVSFFC